MMGMAMSDIVPSFDPLPDEFSAQKWDLGKGFIAANGYAKDVQIDDIDSEVDESIHSSWTEEDITAAFAKGYAEGETNALAAIDDTNAQREKLSQALLGFHRTADDGLAKKLWAAIRQLFNEAVGDADIDEKLFLSRCEKALKLIDKNRGKSVLYVSPSDEKILNELGDDVSIVADEELLPGSVRLVHEGGEIRAGSIAIKDKIDKHITSGGDENAAI